MNGVDKDNLRSAYQYHSNKVQRSLNITFEKFSNKVYQQYFMEKSTIQF